VLEAPEHLSFGDIGKALRGETLGERRITS
jgi:hypothetical protein